MAELLFSKNIYNILYACSLGKGTGYYYDEYIISYLSRYRLRIDYIRLTERIQFNADYSVFVYYLYTMTALAAVKKTLHARA